MPNLWLTLYRLTQDRRKRAILQAFNSEADYQASLSEVTKFWSRCPEPPDFRGKGVLDLGCGLGALVFDAARRGAACVVGIEILDEFTQANNRRLAENFPQFKDRVEFRTVYLADAGPEKFDIILSKDSFEHILELEEHLAQMKAHLNPHGRIYVGFAPLYRSSAGRPPPDADQTAVGTRDFSRSGDATGRCAKCTRKRNWSRWPTWG